MTTWALNNDWARITSIVEKAIAIKMLNDSDLSDTQYFFAFLKSGPPSEINHQGDIDDVGGSYVTPLTLTTGHHQTLSVEALSHPMQDDQLMLPRDPMSGAVASDTESLSDTASASAKRGREKKNNAPPHAKRGKGILSDEGWSPHWPDFKPVDETGKINLPMKLFVLLDTIAAIGEKNPIKKMNSDQPLKWSRAYKAAGNVFFDLFYNNLEHPAFELQEPDASLDLDQRVRAWAKNTPWWSIYVVTAKIEKMSNVRSAFFRFDMHAFIHYLKGEPRITKPRDNLFPPALQTLFDGFEKFLHAKKISSTSFLDAGLVTWIDGTTVGARVLWHYHHYKDDLARFNGADLKTWALNSDWSAIERVTEPIKLSYRDSPYIQWFFVFLKDGRKLPDANELKAS